MSEPHVTLAAICYPPFHAIQQRQQTCVSQTGSGSPTNHHDIAVAPPTNTASQQRRHTRSNQT